MRNEGLKNTTDYSVNAKNSNEKYIRDIYRYYWKDNNFG